MAIAHTSGSKNDKKPAMTFTNEGSRDRVVRILVGFALGYAAWVTWPGTISMVSLVIGAVGLVTGPAGWCPAYAIFGLSTRKKIAA
jgi:hypothetical protein